MLVVLDGRKMTDKITLHQYLKEQCKFPEYYGNNLDALYDVLTDREEPLEIQLLHADEMQQVLCGYGEAFIETLQDACANSPKVTLCVIDDDAMENEDKNELTKNEENSILDN